MNVFSELIHSVYDLKSYSLFLKDKKRKTFLFGFLLVLIYYLITIILPLVRFQVSTGGVMHMIEEVVPDFSIADGRLDMKEQFEFADGDTYFFVDTKNEDMAQEKLLENLRSYSVVLIVDSQNVVVKSNGQVQMLDISDYDLDITKSELIEMLAPFVTIVIGVVLILVFLFMEVTFFFGVLFVGLFGMIVASCVQAKLTFGELYKLGIYTRTTSLLLKAVFSFLPVGIPFYPIVSLGISLAYLAGALRKMNTEDLGGRPVVFYSEGMEKDRWSRPQENPDSWNHLQADEDRWNRPEDYK
ncbi:MAG: DUF1189 domain-containing protein [Lachnospiraceae bacterium]|jgi:hypothetical protein|nr:DUF1189 domain-containing protein [Lachnospiraceae bacterium]